METSDFPDPRRAHRSPGRGVWNSPPPTQPVDETQDDGGWLFPTPSDEARDPRRDMELREQAVERTRFMSLQLAQHAWDLRFSDPLAPHGLALLYAQPAHHTGWYDLKAATRIWLEGDAPRNPA